MIGPLVALGTFTEVQKQIIFNHLQAKLSERFELVSQRRFEKAQNMAFEELDYDQCTEENCIRFIQDTLQVKSPKLVIIGCLDIFSGDCLSLRITK